MSQLDLNTRSKYINVWELGVPLNNDGKELFAFFVGGSDLKSTSRYLCFILYCGSLGDHKNTRTHTHTSTCTSLVSTCDVIAKNYTEASPVIFRVTGAIAKFLKVTRDAPRLHSPPHPVIPSNQFMSIPGPPHRDPVNTMPWRE